MVEHSSFINSSNEGLVHFSQVVFFRVIVHFVVAGNLQVHGNYFLSGKQVWSFERKHLLSDVAQDALSISCVYDVPSALAYLVLNIVALWHLVSPAGGVELDL